MDPGKAYLVELRLRTHRRAGGLLIGEPFSPTPEGAPPHRPAPAGRRSAVDPRDTVFPRRTRFRICSVPSCPPWSSGRLNGHGDDPGGLVGRLLDRPGGVHARPPSSRESSRRNARYRLLATDVSEEALARARGGAYSLFEAGRGLPADLKSRFFSSTRTRRRSAEDIRKSVDFRKLNLAGEWPPLSPMDVVFLRNVLIYFERRVEKKHRGQRRSGSCGRAATFSSATPRRRFSTTRGFSRWKPRAPVAFNPSEHTTEGGTTPPCAS
jgi:hypothetical protein